MKCLIPRVSDIARSRETTYRRIAVAAATAPAGTDHRIARASRVAPYCRRVQATLRCRRTTHRILRQRAGETGMNALVDGLIGWPERVARHLEWLAPLFARITVGYVFMLTGWGKLHNLPEVIENFAGWGIPYPEVLTPLVAGMEFVGGLFLIFGLLTRISAGALGVVVIVAIRSARWEEVDSLSTLLGFDEFLYLALFLWL